MKCCGCGWMISGISLSLGLVYLVIRLYRWFGRCPVKDKVVLITGASSGVGEALAHIFYKAGARVILAARRQTELERVKLEIISTETTTSIPQPECICLDLANLTEIPLAQNIISLHGKVDILINNGGISYRGNVIDTDVDVNVKVMTINHFGQIALTKALLPAMRSQGGGHIVYTSSIQGKISIPQRSAYAASKFASQAYFDAVRAEEAVNNIKVSVICPSYINTPLSINAVTSTGKSYGGMDADTVNGMDPHYVGNRILEAVECQDSEVMLGPLHHHAAVYLRTIAPSLYFLIMKHRAQTNLKTEAKLK